MHLRGSLFAVAAAVGMAWMAGSSHAQEARTRVEPAPPPEGVSQATVTNDPYLSAALSEVSDEGARMRETFTHKTRVEVGSAAFSPATAPDALPETPAEWSPLPTPTFVTGPSEQVPRLPLPAAGVFPDYSKVTGAAPIAVELRPSVVGGTEVPTGTTDVLVPPIVQAPSPPVPVDLLLDVVAVGNTLDFHCTGVLVARNAVLTARHCLPASRVGIGSDVGELAHVIDVVRSVPSPGKRDAALLFVNDLPSGVQPRPWRLAEDAIEPYGEAQLVGYGANDIAGMRGAGTKRRAWITLSGWGCSSRRARTIGCDPENELFIPAQGGIDTCDGDSGGPVFERVGNQARLLGITSRSAKGARQRCGRGGIYVRVDRIAAWMLGEIEAFKQARSVVSSVPALTDSRGSEVR